MAFLNRCTPLVLAFTSLLLLSNADICMQQASEDDCGAIAECYWEIEPKCEETLEPTTFPTDNPTTIPTEQPTLDPTFPNINVDTVTTTELEEPDEAHTFFATFSVSGEFNATTLNDADIIDTIETIDELIDYTALFDVSVVSFSDTSIIVRFFYGSLLLNATGLTIDDITTLITVEITTVFSVDSDSGDNLTNKDNGDKSSLIDDILSNDIILLIIAVLLLIILLLICLLAYCMVHFCCKSNKKRKNSTETNQKIAKSVELQHSKRNMNSTVDTGSPVSTDDKVMARPELMQFSSRDGMLAATNTTNGTQDALDLLKSVSVSMDNSPVPKTPQSGDYDMYANNLAIAASSGAAARVVRPDSSVMQTSGVNGGNVGESDSGDSTDSNNDVEDIYGKVNISSVGRNGSRVNVSVVNVSGNNNGAMGRTVGAMQEGVAPNNGVHSGVSGAQVQEALYMQTVKGDGVTSRGGEFIE